MGWTGRYAEYCPKGAERIAIAVRQEGYQYAEEGRRSDVVASALVGTTVYAAVHYRDAERDEVYCAVIMTLYDKSRQEFLTKGISENMYPTEFDCPKRILDRLTATDDEFANSWRKRCEEKRKSNTERRKNDSLSKLPYGTQIRLTGDRYHDLYGLILTVTHYGGKKTFVDWKNMRKFAKPLIEQCGWELVE